METNNNKFKNLFKEKEANLELHSKKLLDLELQLYNMCAKNESLSRWKKNPLGYVKYACNFGFVYINDDTGVVSKYYSSTFSDRQKLIDARINELNKYIKCVESNDVSNTDKCDMTNAMVRVESIDFLNKEANKVGLNVNYDKSKYNNGYKTEVIAYFN